MEDWILYVIFRTAGMVDFPIMVQVPHCQHSRHMLESFKDQGLRALFDRYIGGFQVKHLERLQHNDSFLVHVVDKKGRGVVVNRESSDPFMIYIQTPRSDRSRAMVSAMIGERPGIDRGLHFFLGRDCKSIELHSAGETMAGAWEGLNIKAS